MQRKCWFELHDHPLFPSFLRDLVTDALEAMWNTTHTYHPIVPRLKAALEKARTQQVVDLCSGGGGPWLGLQSALTSIGCPVSVCLTDKFPNRRAFDKATMQSLQTIIGYPGSVDARCLPSGLAGFRTIFSSFHHFDPHEARMLLSDSVRSREGIAVFEAAECSPRGIGTVFLVPLLALMITPGIRPFKWGRLIWTYALPAIPFVLWLDGLLSSLRSYSRTDMAELVRGLDSESYSWDIGRDEDGIHRITYLIGSPEYLKEIQ
jgi:hypothetical protein